MLHNELIFHFMQNLLFYITDLFFRNTKCFLIQRQKCLGD